MTYSSADSAKLWLPAQSKHHTLDPEQADFFYVPVYTSCFIHPVWGFVDHPWYYGPTQHCRNKGGNTYCATGGTSMPLCVACIARQCGIKSQHSRPEVPPLYS